MLCPKLELSLSTFIANIYQQAYQLKSDDFRGVCLNKLAEFIDFDGALWVTRREFKIAFMGAETFEYQLPNNFMGNYNKYLSSEYLAQDPVTEYAINHPNKQITFWDVFKSRAQFHRHDAYTSHCGKFGLEEMVGTYYFTELNPKLTLLSLYRFHRLQAFSEQDKLIKNIITPHFAQALSINMLAQLQTKESDDNCCRAITDIHGNILEAEDRFIKLLQQYNHNQTEKLLPHSENSMVIVTLANKQKLIAKMQHGFYLFEIPISNDKLRRLTAKQQQLCLLLKQGLSDKLIAGQMGIAPSTVSNHLKQIYKSLNTANRIETIVELLA
jgi:DNA-binding NarL/FixJ family response regulator